MRLAELTTLRVGGEIKKYLPLDNEVDLIAAIKEADASNEPLLVLGGGSNLIASDEPFSGTVIHLSGPQYPLNIQAENENDSSLARFDELTPLKMSCGGAQLEWFAGTTWDDVVQYAVQRGLKGIEALSAIPGSVGATPIQNVGAYGQEVSQTIARVRTYDRLEKRIKSFSASECQFSYRNSIFKQSRMPDNQPTGRYVILSVAFQHEVATLSAPVLYPELARHLGIKVGERVDLASLRAKVLEIRASKGMVLNPADHDTWSAGSFFTNPIIDLETAAQLPADAPRYPYGEQIKTSAAWLISEAKIPKGFTLTPHKNAAMVSTKHALALTNRGEANSEDLVELAKYIKAEVYAKFAITLEPEPVQLGVEI